MAINLGIKSLLSYRIYIVIICKQTMGTTPELAKLQQQNLTSTQPGVQCEMIFKHTCLEFMKIVSCNKVCKWHNGEKKENIHFCINSLYIKKWINKITIIRKWSYYYFMSISVSS